MKALNVARSLEATRLIRFRPTGHTLNVSRAYHFNGLFRPRFYSTTNGTQSSSVPPRVTRNNHFGLLAMIAFFSGTLGYSFSEWQSRSQAGSQSGAPKYASPAEVAAAIKELKAAFPDKKTVITDPATLKTYGSSENSYHPSSPHSVVVHVKSTEDVSQVMKIANKYRVPVTPYGGGTSLEGHYSGVSENT